jgi:hypothetical protein
VGFLADPCTTLASVLPAGAFIPSQEKESSLEVWRQQLFAIRSLILMVSFFLALGWT